MAGTKVWAVAGVIVANIFKQALNEAWDNVWAKYIFPAVVEAEVWYKSAEGAAYVADRKKWVIDKVVASLKSGSSKFNAITEWVVRLALGELVDGFVKSLNDTVGHDWLTQAKEFEVNLAGLLPVIE